MSSEPQRLKNVDPRTKCGDDAGGIIAFPSILECIHLHALAHHEGVRHEAERGVVDLGAADGEERVETAVDALILGRLLLHHETSVDFEAAAAMAELERKAGVRLHIDI